MSYTNYLLKGCPHILFMAMFDLSVAIPLMLVTYVAFRYVVGLVMGIRPLGLMDL